MAPRLSGHKCQREGGEDDADWQRVHADSRKLEVATRLGNIKAHYSHVTKDFDDHA